MVPVSFASGAVGPGWSCGHRSVRGGDALAGGLRVAVWMLQWPTKSGEEDEDEGEVKERGDLET